MGRQRRVEDAIVEKNTNGERKEKKGTEKKTKIFLRKAAQDFTDAAAIKNSPSLKRKSQTIKDKDCI